MVLKNARIVDSENVRQTSLILEEGQIAAQPTALAKEWDLHDHYILPGLVNAHDHLQLNGFPPLLSCSGGAPSFPNSYAWITGIQSRMQDTDVVASRAVPSATRHWQGALKNLLSGVTTVAHHDPWQPVLDDADFPVRVLRRFGWCHSLGLGMNDATRSALRYGPDLVTSFLETPSDQPWMIHLAEGTDALAATELQALTALGCLSSKTVLVHGVGLTQQDIDAILAVGASVAWCPGSNLTMLGKTLEPRRLLQAGRLILGSDSRLTGAQDLLHELRLARMASQIAAKDLFRLVTEAGARLLRWPEVGGHAPGQNADLLILKDTGVDPYEALLALHRADIRAVVRDGKPVVADPDFTEWFALYGIETTRIRLDGVPKLCSTAALGPEGAAKLEPGLEVFETL